MKLTQNLIGSTDKGARRWWITLSNLNDGRLQDTQVQSGITRRRVSI